MSTDWHFPIFVAVSLVAFTGVLRLVLRHRSAPLSWQALIWVAGVVVVGGMTFAKIGATHGLPIWLYYGVPAVLTWVLPPVVFRMRGRELPIYLLLALVVAPAIHLAFSFILGWNEYLPFLPIPSLVELASYHPSLAST
jgi:hypothetical protein